jgi:putative iron-dependent peroxidase
MVTAQPGIFLEGTAAHYALEFEIFGNVSSDKFAAALAKARADAIGTKGVNLVTAFSGPAWERLGSAVPSGMRPFEKIGTDPGRIAPATQRDVLFGLHVAALDDVFDAALAVGSAMASVADPVLDLRRFVYHDSRNLTGFVDDSANPKGDAQQAAALITDGPGTGGAYVLTQQWIHDLESFNALEVPEQEGVIGRTKADSIELEGDAMPSDSHVSRTDVKVDGVAMKIYRRSFPYGSVGAKGLYYLSFACDIARFDIQLQRMFGVSDDGLHDRLTEFNAAVTGSYWFAPPEEDLAAALK